MKQAYLLQVERLAFPEEQKVASDGQSRQEEKGQQAPEVETKLATETQFQRKMRTVGPWLLGVVGLIGVSIQLLATKSETGSTPVIQSTAKMLEMGKIGQLTKANADDLTQAACDAVIKTATANDEDGIKELMEAGHAVVLFSGAESKILDPDFTKHKARVIGGKHKGIAVYTPSEFAGK